MLVFKKKRYTIFKKYIPYADKTQDTPTKIKELGRVGKESIEVMVTAETLMNKKSLLLSSLFLADKES